MKILLVGSFIHPMYAPAFELGFKKLGHEVRTIKYEDFLYGKGQVGQLMARLQNRLHIGLKLSAYNKTIIREANSFQLASAALRRGFDFFPPLSWQQPEIHESIHQVGSLTTNGIKFKEGKLIEGQQQKCWVMCFLIWRATFA